MNDMGGKTTRVRASERGKSARFKSGRSSALLRSCVRLTAHIRDRANRMRSGGFLVMGADVLPHLMMPVRPFVPTLRAPVVQMMRDPAAREHGGHLVGRPAVLPRTTAGREMDVATPVLVEKPGVILVGHVVDRVIEVEIVVVHSVHGIAQVVDA